MKVVTTPSGIQIVQEGVVISEARALPGPTNTPLDVMAACVSEISMGSRLAILGFSAGGVMAPLRAVGFAHAVDAVDCCGEAETVFRRLSGAWSGRVRFVQADALSNSTAASE